MTRILLILLTALSFSLHAQRWDFIHIEPLDGDSVWFPVTSSVDSMAIFVNSLYEIADSVTYLIEEEDELMFQHIHLKEGDGMFRSAFVWYLRNDPTPYFMLSE